MKKSQNLELQNKVNRDTNAKTITVVNAFILSYSRNGELPEVKQKIIKMALNGCGVRDTARVLGVSINTVIRELKKKKQASKQ